MRSLGSCPAYQPKRRLSQEAANISSEPTTSPHPYESLTPDVILDAVDSTGLLADGHLLALPSYENRVYQIGVDPDSLEAVGGAGTAVVAKFYRPGRWSDAQILEEHTFSQELRDQELPVVAPLELGGSTLHPFAGFRVTVYPRQGGHPPAVDDMDSLFILGRTMGRIHAVGRASSFTARPSLSVESFALNARTLLLEGDFIADEHRLRYEVLTDMLIPRLQAIFDEVNATAIRLHGDCHLGNVLWRDDMPHFVDFDDARSGPAMQDLWMMLSGPYGLRQRQLAELIEGYEEFCDFDRREFRLIEPLRTLRLMHHAGWLAQRWEDPAFPPAFPWFANESYWRGHIIELEEQLRAIDEEPLQLMN